VPATRTSRRIGAADHHGDPPDDGPMRVSPIRALWAALSSALPPWPSGMRLHAGMNAPVDRPQGDPHRRIMPRRIGGVILSGAAKSGRRHRKLPGPSRGRFGMGGWRIDGRMTGGSVMISGSRVIEGDQPLCVALRGRGDQVVFAPRRGPVGKGRVGPLPGRHRHDG
jgi:hypothetical protein